MIKFLLGGIFPCFKTETWYVHPEKLTLEFQVEEGMELEMGMKNFLKDNFSLYKVSGFMWLGIYIYAVFTELEKNE